MNERRKIAWLRPHADSCMFAPLQNTFCSQNTKITIDEGHWDRNMESCMFLESLDSHPAQMIETKKSTRCRSKQEAATDQLCVVYLQVCSGMLWFLTKYKATQDIQNLKPRFMNDPSISLFDDPTAALPTQNVKLLGGCRARLLATPSSYSKSWSGIICFL